MTLREKIRRLRKTKDWSQAELAEKVGVHTVHLSHLETGRYQPSIDLLKKLAQVFEVSTDYLLNDDEDESSPIAVEDKNWHQRIRLIDDLDGEERDALLKIIDSLLTKKKLFDLVIKETHTKEISTA